MGFARVFGRRIEEGRVMNSTSSLPKYFVVPKLKNIKFLINSSHCGLYKFTTLFDFIYIYIFLEFVTLFLVLYVLINIYYVTSNRWK